MGDDIVADLRKREHPGGPGVSSYVTSPGRSRNMAAIRRADTKPEVAIRSALHRAGHRFRKDMRLDLGHVKPRPDIVFTRAKVAVFVDGCFWHACPDHSKPPARNAEYWGPKLAGNVERDRRQDEALEADGWTVVRIWEHEPTTNAIAAVKTALVAARSGKTHPNPASRPQKTLA
jgi:DNA mismatch endonuclease (patch repair protein)